MHRMFTDEQELLIIKDYESGIDQKVIGAKLGTPYYNIRNVLLRHNIPIRSKLKFDFIQAKEMYEGGLSYPKIASIFGVDAESLRESMLLRGVTSREHTHTYSCNDKAFSEFTPESCYWAGFLAADGCVHEKKNVISLRLAIKDRDIIEKFKSWANSTYLIYDIEVGARKYKNKIYQCSPQSFMRISSNQWVIDLRENFSLTPRKSLTLNPPLKIPDNLVSHYIRGLFDGDGCAYTKNLAVITSGSPEMVSWLVSKTNGRAYKNSNVWNIHMIASKIGEWLYKDSTPQTRMRRKYERVASQCKRVLGLDI